MTNGAPIVPQGEGPNDTPSLLTSDQDVQSTSSQNQWGLYSNGAPVIISDNVTRMGYKTNADVPTYPQEQGAFQSYNKVQLPFRGTFRFSTGGSVSDRTAMLDSIEVAKQSFDLYDMVIPEETYPNVTVTDYEYERMDGNAGLLPVDVVVEQIRQTGQATFTTVPGQTPITNSPQPGADNPVNDGTVQTNTLTPQQVQALDNLPVGGPGIPAGLFQ